MNLFRHDNPQIYSNLTGRKSSSDVNDSAKCYFILASSKLWSRFSICKLADSLGQHSGCSHHRTCYITAGCILLAINLVWSLANIIYTSTECKHWILYCATCTHINKHRLGDSRAHNLVLPSIEIASVYHCAMWIHSMVNLACGDKVVLLFFNGWSMLNPTGSISFWRVGEMERERERRKRVLAPSVLSQSIGSTQQPSTIGWVTPHRDAIRVAIDSLAAIKLDALEERTMSSRWVHRVVSSSNRR